jgi:hypothetical protein
VQKNVMAIGNVESQIEQQRSELAMQGRLRQAIFDAVTEQDVTAIIKKQIEKAKQGDDKSLQFVMKYVLGFGQPITLQQINVKDAKTAAKVAKSLGNS